MSRVNLSIGKVIAKLVNDANTGLTTIAPLVVDEGTKYPYAVYMRDDEPLMMSKDNSIGTSTANISIQVWHEAYEKVITTAQKVCDAIDGKRGDIAGVYVNNVTITSIADTFSQDANAYGVIINVIVKHQ